MNNNRDFNYSISLRVKQSENKEHMEALATLYKQPIAFGDVVNFVYKSKGSFRDFVWSSGKLPLKDCFNILLEVGFYARQFSRDDLTGGFRKFARILAEEKLLTEQELINIIKGEFVGKEKATL